jgi:hypothetical protein
MGAKCTHRKGAQCAPSKDLVLFKDRRVANCPMKLGVLYHRMERMSRLFVLDKFENIVWRAVQNGAQLFNGVHSNGFVAP